MGLMAKQRTELLEKYPKSIFLNNEDGSITVFSPQIRIGSIWNKEYANILFTLPVGFPFSMPMDFCIDSLITLKNGGTLWSMYNANDERQEVQAKLKRYEDLYNKKTITYFRLRPQKWNCQKDTALTYLRLIKHKME